MTPVASSPRAVGMRAMTRRRLEYRLPLALACLAGLALGGTALVARHGGRASPGRTPGPRPRVTGLGPAAAGPLRFTDVTAGSGLDFRHQNGEEAGLRTILETLGGGAALLDYDGDGRLDVFVAGGGEFVGSGSGAAVRAGPTGCFAIRGAGGSAM